MILEMKVPSPGESITEVEIATWLVSDGDYVEKDQAIAEVDSDKATLELPAEASGIITLKAEEGDAVAVGQVVCLIDTSAEAPEGGSSSTAKSESPAPAVKVETPAVAPSEKATYATGTPSPAAAKLMNEKGLTSDSISGTGRDGRITKEDVLNATPAMGSFAPGANRSESRTKLSMLRRKVAERLVSAKNETAMLTTFNECDLSRIFEIRKKYKEAFSQRHGVNLGFMSFFTKAVTEALNLLTIYSEISKNKIEDVVAEMAGKEYSFLKTKLAEVLISEITPVGKEIQKLLKDKQHLKSILKKGSEKANIIAEENLKNIRVKLGLI